MKTEEEIIKIHKDHFKNPIGKIISSKIKNKEWIVKAKIDKDFLNRIGRK